MGIHGAAGSHLLLFFIFDQLVHPIQCDPPVIPDNPSPPISVRKPGNNMAGTACPHFRGVSVKHACVVGLPVFCKKFADFGVYLVSVVRTRLFCHPDAPIRLKRPFKRFIRLKSHNGFFVFIQISRAVGRNGGNNLGIHIQNAACFPLLPAQFHNLAPKLGGIFCRAFQKGLVPIIRGIIFLDKIPHIHLPFPMARGETSPFLPHSAASSSKIAWLLIMACQSIKNIL